MHSLLEKGLKVFVYCTSGMTRAPTLVIAYLCLYLKHKNWQNPNDVSMYVFNEYFWSVPNMKAVFRMLREYKQFQEDLEA